VTAAEELVELQQKLYHLQLLTGLSADEVLVNVIRAGLRHHTMPTLISTIWSTHSLGDV
jgi:hypothetical protein